MAAGFLKPGFGQTRFFGPSLKIAFFAVLVFTGQRPTPSNAPTKNPYFINYRKVLREGLKRTLKKGYVLTLSSLYFLLKGFFLSLLLKKIIRESYFKG